MRRTRPLKNSQRSDELRRLRKTLLAWYANSKRDLPWRDLDPQTQRPLAYHVLLSEFMLQQTQVATVIPYFLRFMKAFPTVIQLARSSEQEVLMLWQGLGYYSRARNLHRAANQIVDRFDGTVPSSVEDLMTLPGIGRYTAGAIASIAHGIDAPIVDGNVSRVLCRLDAISDDPRSTIVVKSLWDRASDLVDPDRPGDFNSGLMELGATVCTPRNPQCLICPLKLNCKAFKEGLQDVVPAPKKAKPSPVERFVIRIRYRNDQVLLEKRPDKGVWASMWQFITDQEKSGESETGLRQRSSIQTAKTDSQKPELISDDIRLPSGVNSSANVFYQSYIDGIDRSHWQSLEGFSFSHQLTHRRYEFRIEISNDSSGINSDAARGTWFRLQDVDTLPMPNPHSKVRELLRRFTLFSHIDSR